MSGPLLLPCPHCASTDLRIDVVGLYFAWVECNGCEAVGPCGEGAPTSEAVALAAKAWNTDPARSRQAEQACADCGGLVEHEEGCAAVERDLQQLARNLHDVGVGINPNPNKAWTEGKPACPHVTPLEGR